MCSETSTTEFQDLKDRCVFCGHGAEPRAQFWVAMIPLVIVLIIGMKLQHVIATLALEHSGVKGPFVGVLLKPRDQLFWFNRSKFLLHVIHFIFFEVSITAFKFIRQYSNTDNYTSIG